MSKKIPLTVPGPQSFHVALDVFISGVFFLALISPLGYLRWVGADHHPFIKAGHVLCFYVDGHNLGINKLVLIGCIALVL